MFLGWPELTLIILILLLVLGPSKLPQLAKSMGQTVREFRKATAGTIETVQEATKPAEAIIMDLAKSMGVNVEGKTPTQAADEIVKKLKK